MSQEGINTQFRTHVGPEACCDILEKMEIEWMVSEQESKRCMPYIIGKQGTIRYRVNHCPSCGKYIRDIKLDIK